MPSIEKIGPYKSRDLLSPYDVATALNTIDAKIDALPTGGGGGGGPITALDIATTGGTPGPTTFLAGDNTWKIITAGGGTFTGTGDPGLTRAQAITTNFTDPPPAIRTLGYTIPGRGGGLHIKKDTTPSHSGYFTTADGSIYELVPEYGQLNIEQFGAIPMVNHLVQPAQGAVDDIYPALVKADKFIKAYQFGTITPGNITLRIPGGVWFWSVPHQMKRCSYRITGDHMMNTYVRHPPYSDGFVISYTWSCGRDYTVFGPSAPIIPGMALWKTDLQLSPGNVYRCVSGGTLAASGDPLTGNTPGTVYMHGTAGFKYETNVGPGSFYDYDITSTNFAENSVIENLQFWGFWDPRNADANYNKWPDQNPDLGGEPIYNCGIIMRARAQLNRILMIGGYNGGCVAVIANGDRNLKGAGNTNGWDLRHCVLSGGGKFNLHVSNSDSNAGSVTFLDSSYAGRMGVEDFSFLGDNYEAVQDAYSGSSITPFRQYPGGCLYNGFGWRARLPILGVENWPNYVGEEPGGTAIAGPIIPWIRYFGDGNQGVAAKLTGSISGNTLTVSAVASGVIAIGQMIASNESVTSGRVRPGTKITAGSGSTWTVDGATQTVASGPINAMSLGSAGGSEYPDWTPTKKFEPCGAWGSNSVNARNLWKGMYIEGGTMPAQPGPRDTVIGGLQQGDVDRTRGALILDDNAFTYLQAFGLRTSPGGGGNFSSRVTLGGNGDAAETILNLSNYEGHSWAIQHINGTGPDGITGRDISIFRDKTGPGVDPLIVTGHATAKTFGGSAGNTMPSVLFANMLVVGYGNAAYDGRPVTVGHGAPTSGFYRQGHTVLDDGSGSTTAGQPSSWKCKTEGTPGVWVVASVYA
jgi:hypothetical protein